MKKIIILLVCFFTTFSLVAQERVLFYSGSNVIYNKLIENVDYNTAIF